MAKAAFTKSLQLDLGVQGSTGLKQYGGWIFEEFLPRLQGRTGVLTYREMIDNSSTIGAIRYTIRSLILQAEWRVEPAGDTPEAREWAEFVEGCLDDMSHTFEDFLSELLSHLDYGWAYHELVYKIRRGPEATNPSYRSKHDDGKVGWRKIPIRSQDTLDRWEFEPSDNGVRGMWQFDPYSPKGSQLFIPIEKALLFRTSGNKGNPEGRALTLDTSVPTPDGWTTMGAIEVGDKVYDERGRIRYVTAKTEVFRDRPVYEIEFKDGSAVRADTNHLWSVTDYNDRTLGREPRTISTEELFAKSQKSTDLIFSCGRAPVLDAPNQPLPVDPYLLGYWLGDGAIGTATFSVCDEDLPSLLEQISAAGHEPGARNGNNISVPGVFREALKVAGVYRNKHIPATYLRASSEQRLALLQGLMDSDGFTPAKDAKDVASVFHNTDLNLIHGVAELVRTLGGRPKVKLRQRAGRLGGELFGRQIVGRRDLWEVRFSLDLPTHRLPRKRERQKLVSECDREVALSHHVIRNIRRVENADTVCIEVDAPSHLFLAGDSMVPTHNSIYRNAVLDYFKFKRITDIEAVGIERDMTGLLHMQVPIEILQAAPGSIEMTIRSELERMLGSLKRDEREFAMTPPELNEEGMPTGFKLGLLATGGRRQIDTNDIALRYMNSMTMSTLADFLMLGKNDVGSWALASSKTRLFSFALGAIMDAVAAVFNRFAIPRLMALNSVPVDLHPHLVHGDIESPPLDEIGNYITSLATAGLLTPTKPLERKLLEFGRLPAPPVDEEDKPLPGEGARIAPEQLLLPLAQPGVG